MVFLKAIHGDLHSLPELAKGNPVHFVFAPNDDPTIDTSEGVVRQLEVRNISLQPVEIYGLQDNCDVLAISESRFTVTPFSRRKIPVWLRVSVDKSVPVKIFCSTSPSPITVVGK
jgi:hypothetical protein